ncbi:hypothetical protein [Chitinimonas sp. BJB300]|uniref:hypothetical protein n=1 Tax=Chitinimonas sp. BJB300 TaxID=1559339 RepID=UPI000C1071D8|nr:hypothetical protein [Chitinimonas sp. BJB300]PHV12997.1 hypothetical protein CSQ89_02700 [Chitinimonas sp. BJB300]TSJ88946.1 hypothetical protein FG002_008625 [Chitinimonas sp. BJB300]
MHQQKLKVSLKLFVLDIIGAILAAFGLLGVVGEGGQVHPWLADRAHGAILVVVGLGLMAWFMFDLFKRIRAQRQSRTRQHTS